MKIKIQGFCGNNHSWSYVHQNIARSFSKKGHEVHLNSTNGYEHFPSDLNHLIKSHLDDNYDMQISYTAMINFPRFLSGGSKNRFGIWNYEFTVLPNKPQPFNKFYTFTDKFLPSSNFSKEIFLQNNIPENHMEVIPHGVDLEHWSVLKPYKLNTNKKTKILANIAQPHIRKNLTGLLEAYGLAFNKDDNVCLILKVVDKPPSTSFEVSFSEIYKEFNKKYPKHAECEVIKNYIPDIGELYKATDIVFTMSHSECFYFPGLEALATNNINVCPRYGGQLDFLNDNNSLLVDGQIIRAPIAAQYWNGSPYSAMFDPSISDAVEKLRLAVSNIDDLKNKFSNHSKDILNDYTWDKVTDKILTLVK